MANPLSRAGARERLALGLVISLALVAAIHPVVRAFYRFEVNYNEGWNIYNSVAVAHHVPLYGTKYGWTTVNYPLLWFYVVAYFSGFTRDYLLAGRLLSLLSMGASCVLVGLIIKRLTGGLAAALFGGFFCLALFCTMGSAHVGANDPQLCAQAFFLVGLLVYVFCPPTLACIGAIALLFALGGNIKHNLIDFPFAIFLDLLLVSRRRAFQFVIFLGILAGLSVWANTTAGGPFFVSNLLAGRSYSEIRALLNFAATDLPIFFLLLVACVWAVKQRNIRASRLLSIFFFSSLLFGIAFGGGEGVSTNSYFDNFLALAMIVGILFHDLSPGCLPGFRRPGLKFWAFASLVPASLVFAIFLSGNDPFWQSTLALPVEQARFDREVSFLASRPGPALCESLLRCYAAGKPYVYDPFNSQRLMRAGKLDSNEIVRRIAAHQYTEIQTSLSVKSYEQLRAQLPRTGFHPVTFSVIQLGSFAAVDERFPENVLTAIDAYYVLSVENPDCDIYVPRTGSASSWLDPIHY